MNVAAARLLKVGLCHEVEGAIKAFEKASGLLVTAIDLERVNVQTVDGESVTIFTTLALVRITVEL